MPQRAPARPSVSMSHRTSLRFQQRPSIDTEDGAYAPGSQGRTDSELSSHGYQGVRASQTFTLQSDGSAKTRIRIIEPSRSSQRINTERTIASLILGKGSAAEAFLFDLAVKHKWFGRILWSCWWVGAACGMTSLSATVPDSLAFACIFMLPLPFFVVSVLCLDLIWEILYNFETFLISGMQLLLMGTAIYLLRDARVTFWICLLPTMICASLVDAYPAKFRPFFSKCFFSSLAAVYLCWLFFLFFAWGEIHDNKWEIGELAGNTVISNAQNTVTLLAFCGRSLATAVMNPSNYVLITSAMKTNRVYVEAELKLIDGEMAPTGKYLVTADKIKKLDMTVEELHPTRLDMKMTGKGSVALPVDTEKLLDQNLPDESASPQWGTPPSSAGNESEASQVHTPPEIQEQSAPPVPLEEFMEHTSREDVDQTQVSCGENASARTKRCSPQLTKLTEDPAVTGKSEADAVSDIQDAVERGEQDLAIDGEHNSFTLRDHKHCFHQDDGNSMADGCSDFPATRISV